LLNIVYNIVKALEKETKILHDIIEDLKDETSSSNEVATKRQKTIEQLEDDLDELQKKYDKIYKLMFGRLVRKK
jgi:predicted nuclease with TOPRIM domain